MPNRWRRLCRPWPTGRCGLNNPLLRPRGVAHPQCAAGLKCAKGTSMAGCAARRKLQVPQPAHGAHAARHGSVAGRVYWLIAAWRGPLTTGGKNRCGAGVDHCGTQAIPITPLEIVGLRLLAQQEALPHEYAAAVGGLRYASWPKGRAWRRALFGAAGAAPCSPCAPWPSVYCVRPTLRPGREPHPNEPAGRAATGAGFFAG